MIDRDIAIRLPDGSITKASVRLKDNDPACELHLSGVGIDEAATGTDYFEAFAAIRRRLSKRSIYPLCYGASRNVWPSAMARDMGQGLAAYKMTMGLPGGTLVNIFDTGPDVEPATPEEQEAFFQAWFTSLK